MTVHQRRVIIQQGEHGFIKSSFTVVGQNDDAFAAAHDDISMTSPIVHIEVRGPSSQIVTTQSDDTFTVTVSSPTKMEQIILDGVPEPDRNVVRGYAQLILNTAGGIPSSAAQQAVSLYHQIGRDALQHRSNQTNVAAMRSCGCSACAADVKRLS